MKKQIVVWTLLALCLPAMAFAASPAKPGQWQQTFQMEIPGMPIKMPPVTVTVCLTEEDLNDPNKAVPKDPKSDCKVGDYKVDGNTVTWSMDCPKQSMKGDGKITYDGDSYAGAMKMVIGEQEMTMKYSGKYLGGCEKK